MEAHLLYDFFSTTLGSSPILQGFVGGLIIAFFNLVGALLVLVWRKPSERVLNVGLGLAAGVMLTASFTSLILPGIEYGGIWAVIIGMTIGAALLAATDIWIPHLHIFKGREGAERSSLKAVWLFIIAITI